MRAPTWTAGTAVLFALMVLAWGGNYLFVRVGELYVGPLWLAFLRAGVGAAGAAVVLALRSGGPALSWRDRRDAVCLGVPNTAVFLALWFVAAPSVAPGVASVVIYTFPLWVAVLSPSVLGARLGPRHWAAIAIGFAGVVLVSRPWSESLTSGAVRPFFELLAAAVSWALATVLFQRRFSGQALAQVNAYQLAGGAAVLLILAGTLRDGTSPGLSPGLWVSVAWLGLFGTAFAYGVWFFLLRKLHASTLSAFAFLVPLTALGLSAVFEGERVSLIQAMGVVLVLAGIYLVGRTPLAHPDHASVIGGGRTDRPITKLAGPESPEDGGARLAEEPGEGRIPKSARREADTDREHAEREAGQQ